LQRLRVKTLGFEPRSRLTTTCPLLVEGTLKNPGGDAAEYQLLMDVRNDSGTLLIRQVIDVGAVKVYEKRIFSLRIEMSTANSTN